MNQAVRIWTSDFGDIALPEDFPENSLQGLGGLTGGLNYPAPLATTFQPNLAN